MSVWPSPSTTSEDSLLTELQKKNKKVSTYRKCLPCGALVWLLLYTRPGVSRSVPIPYGIDEWRFPFDFERVFWLILEERRVVEIQQFS